ncbi:tetratricopeptide repeat-containing sulfotransferase family protein [Alteraurantiacibacter palmitatis]|uniref:Sulfotransferase n=1 Tax=Alteraurantiacibacter palmitatis TaxID=2054628 RepID=A0ABV7EAY2_9SPHN
MTASDTIARLEAQVARDPQSADGWRALGDAWTARGNMAAADAAYAQSIRAATRDPELLQAANALVAGELAVAEPILRARLKRAPTDVAAIRMLAELASRLGRYGDAEKLLARVLQLAPGFRAARHNYALVLHRQNRAGDALAQIDILAAEEPDNPALANLKAAVLGRIGEYEDALDLYARVLERQPAQPKVWMSYGHALKTVGRQGDAVEAYRRAIALEPGMGEVWWSLANLKRVTFDAADIAAMQGALEQDDLSADDRFHLHFALGKALEDAGDYAASFAHYAQGNAQRRAMVRYDPDEIATHVTRSAALFTPAFFAARQGYGCPTPDPIFILGMPRAGSTLIEQILASHSLVEGTMELPDLPQIAARLGGRKLRSQDSAYPEILADLSAQECAALGEEYLERTRIQRKTDAPFFIDKMPNNFLHIGLIRLILPKAKIIDARRHPLACCFSNFKQHFARGQAFSYDLAELGGYCLGYTQAMAHFDAVQPGAVHRVFYEAVVDDLEGEVRRLLGFLGLPFEEACLNYHASERAVRTASSEQVRQPIFREGLNQWRHYQEWLGPLKAALGPALVDYPFAT